MFLGANCTTVTSGSIVILPSADLSRIDIPSEQHDVIVVSPHLGYWQVTLGTSATNTSIVSGSQKSSGGHQERKTEGGMEKFWLLMNILEYSGWMEDCPDQYDFVAFLHSCIENDIKGFERQACEETFPNNELCEMITYIFGTLPSHLSLFEVFVAYWCEDREAQPNREAEEQLLVEFFRCVCHRFKMLGGDLPLTHLVAARPRHRVLRPRASITTHSCRTISRNSI